MEKYKFSKKTVLKLTGALFSLVYFGFCLYAGITGKFSSMQKKEYVVRFGDLKNWVSGGMSAVMLAILCIHSAVNDLKLQNGRKKSSALFFFIMLLFLSLPLLLESYLDIGWIGIAFYAGSALLLFGIAWIPQILNQWISRLLLSKKSMSGKQQLQIIEWIHFYPLKKLLLLGLWGFGVVIILCGIWGIATGEVKMDRQFLLTLLCISVFVVILFPKIKRYICISFHSVPVLNQILRKKQLEQLLERENFERIPFKDPVMNKYLDIFQSQSWMLIGGKLISKKLALWVTMDCSKNDTLLKVLYLNGRTAKVKVNLEIRENRYEEFTSVLRELIGYEGTLKLYEKEEQLAEKFTSCFPNLSSDQERIAFFLTQDATGIRKDYIQSFSSPETRRKKGRIQEKK